MPRKRRAAKPRVGLVGSPYVRYVLATGEPPVERVHGWVRALITHGDDNVPTAALVARYGEALRDECRAAGFVPDCDMPLRRQSAEARAAAERWAAAVIAEGRY